MLPLDIDFIRAQFPAFAHPATQQWVMSENAGGSYAAKPVIDQLNHFMTATKVQPYWSFAASAEAGANMDRSTALWTAALNAEPEEVMFGPSTSINTYVLANSLRAELKLGDEIIVTNQDHEANSGAWRRLADGNSGIVVREFSVDRETGRLDMAKLKGLLNARTKLVFITHCSNIVGEIHDIAEITKEVHAAGARIGVDGVSCAPHLLPDVPKGTVGWLWNERDERVAWVADVGRIMNSEDAGAHVPDDNTFSHYERMEFPHEQRLDVEGLVALAGTRSYLIMATPERREAVFAELRRLAAIHPDLRGRDHFEMPYRTVVYRARLK